MLSGSLIEAAEIGPNRTGYAWSRAIPDPEVNFGYGIREAGDFAWAGAFALGRGRSPAFLVRDANEVTRLCRFFAPAAIKPTTWMIAETARPRGAAEPGHIACHAGARPPPDFEGVLVNLSEAAAVRAHLRRHYLPALRTARARPGIAPVHLVLHDAVGPASCASLYLRGEIAGLYNLGTRADRRRRGLGPRLILGALATARSRGARAVFMPCATGAPLETLAARHGFRAAFRPSLVCVGPT